AEWITASGGSEHGPTEVGDPPDRVGRQGHQARLTVHFSLQEAGVTAADAKDFPAVVQRRERCCADHGVQAGGVSSSGVDCDALYSSGTRGHVRAIRSRGRNLRTLEGRLIADSPKRLRPGSRRLSPALDL